MVFEVRVDLCQRAPPQDRSPRRSVASRRSVPEDKRSCSLPLACGRSGWRCSRYSGPEQKKHKSSEEVLTQVIKGVAICPARDHYGQAEELQCSESRSSAERRTHSAE